MDMKIVQCSLKTEAVWKNNGSLYIVWTAYLMAAQNIAIHSNINTAIHYTAHKSAVVTIANGSLCENQQCRREFVTAVFLSVV